MTIIKQKKQRVAIFIDAQNLYHSAKSAYGANVNFKNILEDTLAGRELVRAIAYVIKTESGEEKNFFDALEKSGIETKSKDLQVFLGGAKKGDWDVGMTVDAIRMAPKVDAVVIVSGDGDFIPLVEYLKFSSGCQVEAATFRSSASSGLVEVVDDFFDLSENLGRYLMKGSRVGRFRYSGRTRLLSEKGISIKDPKPPEIGGEMEEESPEMIAERVAAKRGLSSGIKRPLVKKRNSKATEVEITRIKKEDFVEKEIEQALVEDKKGPEQQSEKKKESKITSEKKKRAPAKKEKKDSKEKIKLAVKKAVVKKEKKEVPKKKKAK